MGSPAVKSFNGGELSPLLFARTDLEKYQNGCQELENMIPLIQGAVTRRPGTEYINEAHTDTGGDTKFGRLIPFSRSNEISYILEFGENYIRVYNDGSRVEQGNTLDAYSATESYKPGDWVSYNGTDYFCIQAGIGKTPDTFTGYWTSGLPYQIWTPWTTVEQINNLQYVQSIDVMYIVHPDFAVYKLSSTGADDFTLEKVDFTYQAFLDENVEFNDKVKVSTVVGNLAEDWIDGIDYPEGATVWFNGAGYKADRDISGEEDYGIPSDANAPWTTPSGGYLAKGSLYTMTSSGSLEFSADDVGKHWLIKTPKENNSISETLKAAPNNVSSSLAVKGDWKLVTHGTWTGDLDLQRSYDEGTTWVDYRLYSSEDDANYEDDGTEEVDGVLYRLNFTRTSGNCTINLSVNDPYYFRIYKIVKSVNSGEVVVQSLQDGISSELYVANAQYFSAWAEGAWGGENGYPRAVSIFEERLCFGGNEKKPSTIWTSKINDYENLTAGVLDTDAIIYTISSEKVYLINWLVSQNVLLIGTSGDEWRLGGSKSDEAMTPTNIKSSRQSSFGSEYKQPLLINNSIFFIQRGARKIREMAYNWQEESYVSNDITVMADHITEGGIKQMAFMHNPHPILWICLDNGNWAGFTYEKEQQVYAWHRHAITDYDIKSLAVIPATGNNDELWLACETEYAGNFYTYIAKMADFNYDEVYDEYNGDEYNGTLQLTTPPPIMSSAWFLDMAKQEDSDHTVQVLNGQTATSPYTFDITGHNFTNGMKIIVRPDVNFDVDSYYEEVFTISDVSGSTFKLKNKDNTNYFVGTKNFSFTLFVAVDNTMTIQTPWRGKEVQSLVDGKIDVTTDPVGASGTITFDNYGAKQLVGVPYTSTLQPMSIEAELADGASQGRRKRIRRVVPRFYETIGCRVYSNDGEEMSINWRRAPDAMDTVPTLYSGYKVVNFKDGWDRHADVILKQDIPYPMTVTMLQVWIDPKD